MSDEDQSYWQRLKEHPGVPVVVFLTIGGGLAAGKEHWQNGLLCAVVTLLFFGSIVLWSNRRK